MSSHGTKAIKTCLQERIVPTLPELHQWQCTQYEHIQCICVNKSPLALRTKRCCLLVAGYPLDVHNGMQAFSVGLRIIICSYQEGRIVVRIWLFVTLFKCGGDCKDGITLLLCGSKSSDVRKRAKKKFW